MDSFTVNTNPKTDNEVSSKNCVDELLNKNTNPRFNQSLQICLKLTAGNTDFNYTNYGRIQGTDTTKVKTVNAGSVLLPLWKTECNGRNGSGISSTFSRATESNTPTPNTKASAIPKIGDSTNYYLLNNW